MNVSPANLFLLPLHVVLPELVIDSACSIVLERQPAEKDIMERKPRKTTENIENTKNLTKSLLQSLLHLIKDKVMWIVNLGTIAGLLLIIYSPINSFLKLAPLSFSQFLFALAIAAGSVLWYDLVKLVKNLKNKKQI